MGERLQTATIIARAAALRAAGRTWDEVGAELSRSPKALRAMPSKHPDAWRAAYAEAHEAVVDVARDKALRVLADAMDDERPDIRVRAADVVWGHAIKERPPTQRVEAAMTFEAIMPHREAPDGG